MMQPLPFGNFKVCDILWDKILNTSGNADIECAILVDLKYPTKNKDKTKYLPLSPRNEKTNENDFTSFMKEHKPDHYKPHNKLMCDQNAEKCYKLHYKNLKFLIRMGMIVEKIHELISFNQCCWLKKQTGYCSEKRAQAKTDSINFFQTISSSIFW